MLDFGWPELLIIALVLILVVGPKDLPAMLRSFGRTTKKLRTMAGEFRSQFDEALKEADMDDVRQALNDAQKLNPRNMLKDVVDPIAEVGRDIKSDLDKTMTAPFAATSEETTGSKPGAEESKPVAAAKAATGSQDKSTGKQTAGRKATRGTGKAATGKAATGKAATGKAATGKSATKPASGTATSRASSKSGTRSAAKSTVSKASAKTSAAKTSAAKPPAAKSTAAKSTTRAATAKTAAPSKRSTTKASGTAGDGAKAASRSRKQAASKSAKTSGETA